MKKNFVKVLPKFLELKSGGKLRRNRFIELCFLFGLKKVKQTLKNPGVLYG